MYALYSINQAPQMVMIKVTQGKRPVLPASTNPVLKGVIEVQYQQALSASVL
ncbi:hypothetical protein OAN61_00010 [bacterium]|nr:hypothetical protein [bacterium]